MVTVRKPSRTLPCLLAFVSICSAADPARLTGTGSTFIHPILSKWSKEYRQLHPDVEIYYEGLGREKEFHARLRDWWILAVPMDRQRTNNWNTPGSKSCTSRSQLAPSFPRTTYRASTGTFGLRARFGVDLHGQDKEME